MADKQKPFSFKKLFVPFTSFKAAHHLILLGLLVYSNSLLNGFIGDDNSQIVNNPSIRSLSNIPLFFKGSTMYLEQIHATVGVYYRPMLSATYSLLYALFGTNAFFFHLFQLGLHITNSLLLYLIFKNHLYKRISFILATIFLLHPINNEAIVYLANLQEELFTFFGMLTLIFLIKQKSLIICSIMLLFSLLSKETGIIFIPLTILYYALFLAKQQNRFKHILLAFSGVLISYLVLRFYIVNLGFRTELLYMTKNATFLQRLYTIPSILLYYIKMTILPFSIAFAWYWVVKTPTLFNFYIPICIDLVVSIILTIPIYFLKSNHKQRNIYIYFFIVFIISLSASLQIVPLYSTVADRWFYVPLIGLLGICGITYQSFTEKIIEKKYLKILGLVFLLTMLLFFSVRDITRNFDFKDSFTICKHDAQINTQSFLLEYCLGNEYFIKQEYPLARTHTLKAIELYPQYFLSWYTLGQIYFAQQDKVQAQNAFKKTLELNNFAYGSGELALIYVYENKITEAKDVIEKYMKQTPRAAKLWYALALAEFRSGNKEEAITAAKQAYSLNPTPATYKVYYRLTHNMPITF